MSDHSSEWQRPVRVAKKLTLAVVAMGSWLGVTVALSPANKGAVFVKNQLFHMKVLIDY